MPAELGLRPAIARQPRKRRRRALRTFREWQDSDSNPGHYSSQKAVLRPRAAQKSLQTSRIRRARRFGELIPMRAYGG